MYGAPKNPKEFLYIVRYNVISLRELISVLTAAMPSAQLELSSGQPYANGCGWHNISSAQVHLPLGIM
jgi:hypothetical protein